MSLIMGVKAPEERKGFAAYAGAWNTHFLKI